jgi:hypothetical protein
MQKKFEERMVEFDLKKELLERKKLLKKSSSLEMSLPPIDISNELIAIVPDLSPIVHNSTNNNTSTSTPSSIPTASPISSTVNEVHQ